MSVRSAESARGLSVLNEKDFRSIPGLRWRLGEDGSPYAHSIKKRLIKDFLCFHGPGKLGIYFFRQSPRDAKSALRYWRARCGKLLEFMLGDTEGYMIFQVEHLEDIPREFIKGRRGTAAGGRLRGEGGKLLPGVKSEPVAGADCS